MRNRSWLAARLLIALLLLGAQSGALAHAFEHDAATPQNQACAICFTISQLDAGSIDAFAAIGLADSGSILPAAIEVTLQSLHETTARQRGPPNPP